MSDHDSLRYSGSPGTTSDGDFFAVTLEVTRDRDHEPFQGSDEIFDHVTHDDDLVACRFHTDTSYGADAKILYSEAVVVQSPYVPSN